MAVAGWRKFVLDTNCFVDASRTAAGAAAFAEFCSWATPRLVMPDDLKERLGAFVPPPPSASRTSTYAPPPVEQKPVIRVMPNLEIVASGEGVDLLEDVSERSGKVLDRGLVRLIECDDSALAALIASDSRTRKHCRTAGERHLVVLLSSEAAFRRAL